MSDPEKTPGPALVRLIDEQARAFGASVAGVVEVEAVRNSPSHRNHAGIDWPQWARSVLVLGLAHLKDRPELDWWGGPGGTPGNRVLGRTGHQLMGWLELNLSIRSVPLSYHVERGGIFLKDAAVLAGLGVIGENNLVITPAFGPRIRFRAMFMDAVLDDSRSAPTSSGDPFAPCRGCPAPCSTACPVDAFASGSYAKRECSVQMHRDEARPVAGHADRRLDLPDRYVTYCRECEFACPVPDPLARA